MMHKIVSVLVVHVRQLKYLKNKKNEKLTKGTNGVLAKNHPKVKSVIEKSPITQKCKS